MNRLRPRVVEAAPLRYLLHVPARTEPEQPLPVLCFLHGYDEAAPVPIDTALTRHGPLRPDNPPWAYDRCIIVAPQLPVAGDLWPRFANAVGELLVDVQQAHRGDPERTALTGFSFGANGVFDLAHLLPGRWSALWAVDPTRVPTSRIDAPVWLSFGQVARARRSAFIDALGLQEAHGAEVSDGERWYLDEGADHVGSATHAYQDRRIYDWLLTRRASRP